MQHFTLLERNLLYTGVTRAKQLMVLLAEPRALNMALRQQRAKTRLTNLEHQLRAKLHPLLNDASR